MPENAIAHAEPQYVLPIEAIAPVLIELIAADRTEDVEADESTTERVSVPSVSETTPEGKQSDLTCPECGGALWEQHDGQLVDYECRIGHRFTGESLAVEHDEALEGALSTSLRALEERAVLARRLAARARTRGSTRSAEHFDERAVEADRNVAVVREALRSLDMSPPPAREGAEA
jgi:two-component system chemotaxis response regulator CheB